MLEIETEFVLPKIFKAVHYADLQVQARPTELGNRFDEYKIGLKRIEQKIEEINPDVIFFIGDAIEFNAANGDELKLLGDHIRTVAKKYKMIFTLGNHDIKQQNNEILEAGNTRMVTNFVELLINQIDSENVVLFKGTGFYRAFGKTFAVWCQTTKHDPTDERPYSPWELEDAEYLDSSKVIELYHDPFFGCSDFNEMPSYETHGGLEKFKGATVVGGDIHKHGVYVIGEYEGRKRYFTFSSSCIMRNFGEGDYIKNGIITQHGNEMHGINEIIFEDAFATEIIFHPIKPHTGRTTIQLDADFGVENIDKLAIVETYDRNDIRVVIESNENGLIQLENEIVQTLLDKYENTNVRFGWDKNVNISVSADGNEFSNVNELLNKETIIGAARDYIETVVNKTSTLTDDQREAAKDEIVELFETELAKVDNFEGSKKVKLISSTINNYQVFGDGVQHNYTNGLNHILASNGIGKSKFAKFVRWMFTDTTEDSIKRTKKTANRSIIFNDFRDKNEVSGYLNLEVNGQIWEVEKVLTRKLKRKSRELSGVPKLSLLVRIGGEEFKNDAAQAKLDSIMTVDEWNMFIYMNQINLERLVHTDAETLNETILKIIGFDVIENMVTRVKELKAERTKGLRNPAKTVEAILKEIEQQEKSIVEYNQQAEVLKDAISELGQKNNACNTVLEEKFSKLYNVGSVTEVENHIANTKTSIELCEKTITDSKALLESYNTKIVEGLEVEREKLTGELNLTKNSKSLLESRIAEYEAKLESTKDKMLTIVNGYRNRFDVDVQNRKAVVDARDVDKTILANNLKTLKNEKGNILSELQLEHQKAIGEFQKTYYNDLRDFDKTKNDLLVIESVISAIKFDIDRLNSDVDSLESQKVCSACNRIHDEKTLIVVRENITNKVAEIEEKRAELATKEAEKEKLSQVWKTQHEKQTASNDALNSIKNKVVSIPTEHEIFTKISDAEKMLESFVVETQKMLNEVSVFEATKTDVVREQALQDSEIIAIKAQREVLTNDIAKEKKSIDEIDSNIKTQQNVIYGISGQIVQNDKLKKELSELKDSLSELENERLPKLNAQLLEYTNHTDKAKADEVTHTEIKVIKEQQAEIKQELDKQDTILNFDVSGKIKYAEYSINSLKKEIEDSKEYRLKTAVVDIYSTMLSKKGLSKYLFSKISNILNRHLNDLLGKTNFRLSFDPDTLLLTFNDLEMRTTRPVISISGMEVAFSGLSLVCAMLQQNNRKSYDFMFIDEVTGQLNSGDELKGNAKNYQSMFVELLQIINNGNLKLYVIDHVIKNLPSDHVVNLVKTQEGTKIAQ